MNYYNEHIKTCNIHSDLLGRRVSRFCVHNSVDRHVVCRIEQAFIQSAQLDVRSCMDNTVHYDGCITVSRMGYPQEKHQEGVVSLRRTVVIESSLVIAVLRSEESAVSVGRNNNIVGGHSADDNGVQEILQDSGLSSNTIHNMGELCCRIELYNSVH